MELAEVVRSCQPFLELWLDHHRRFAHVPGVQVAVRVGDELCASFALGSSRADTGAPLTTGHLFHIASHSKTFTATAVMQLVEQGRLRLDDSVASWLPELADSPVADRTVRELLGHQSGITRDGDLADHWQLEVDFPDRAGILALARQDAVLGPNEFFAYSNVGYSLLGLVVEAASGSPYEQYVTEHVVERLGLSSTGPEVPAERRGELAGAHGLLLDPTEPRAVLDDIPSRAEAAATGFYSTAEETTRFLACHAFGREELLSDASKRLMQRRESRITRGGERFYGLGMILREVGGRTLVGHSGGWPGHITNSWLDPQRGLCVSVLSNCLGAPSTSWATAIVELVDQVAKDAERSAPALPQGLALADFTGRFVSTWGQLDLVALGGQLYAADPSMLSPELCLTRLDVADAETLTAEPEDSFGAPGEPIRLVRSADGRIEQVVDSGITHRRLEDRPTHA